jgi:hypothetical protein
MAGTGVAPVKSGVAPDFVGRRWLRVDVRRKENCGRPAGFGRDARNHRLEASATCEWTTISGLSKIVF